MGTLYIVATPIGNLDDITIRAIKILLTVDIIASEDTRRTGSLLKHVRTHYGHLTETDASSEDTFVRYDNQKEARVAPRLIDELERGKSVALVSDSGTPLIADPGFSLVTAAIKRNIQVVPIPGPNAAVTALSASGLPVNHCLFVGFLPEKKSKRHRLLEELRHIRTNGNLIRPTIIAYCAPHKLTNTLEDIYAVFGNVDLAIAREMTKIHEEFWKGTVLHGIHHFKDPKGEFTILF